MHIRLLRFWEDIRGSYWFVPGVMIFGAILLALATIALDDNYPTSALGSLGFIWNGGAQGTRGILQTVAGSMITVAGVTFSITMVALSFASSQFGSRLLRSFMTDVRNQFVLGTFIATFIFCLLVLGSVGSGSGDQFIPYLSVTVGLLLVLASLGVLIYFIHHMALSMQAPYVIGQVAEDLLNSIDNVFSFYIEGGGHSSQAVQDEQDVLKNFDDHSSIIRCDTNGYIQAIDEEKLIEFASRQDLAIELPNRPGHFLMEGDVLALVLPENRVNEEVEKEIKKYIVIGKQRIPIQDVEFGIEQLVEVAERSLSASINATFTALLCIDWLAAALAKLLKKDFPSPYRYDRSGKLRLVFVRPLTLEGVIDAAFNPIRQSAHENVAVRIRLLEKIALLLEKVDDEQARQALERQADLIENDHGTNTPAKEDQMDVHRRYQRIMDNDKT